MHFGITILSIIGLSLPRPLPALAAAQTPAKTTVTSTELVKGEPGLQYEISPQGLHLAAVVLRGSRQVMVHDGKDGPPLQQILPGRGANTKVEWSEDGSRWAYRARQGQNYIVMVDGAEVHKGDWSPQLETQGQTPVQELGFTPGGKHWYLIVMTQTPGRSNYQLIIDGVAGPVSQEVIRPVWSLDGERHAYIQTISPETAAQPRQVLIVDGKPAPYLAGAAQFTGDSKHLITQRMIPRSSVVEVLANGQPLMRVEGGAELTMVPGSPAIFGRAWATTPTRGSYLMIGNRKAVESDCTDNAGLSHLYFSADYKHYAARCRTWILADGKKGQEYPDGVSNVVFTADGRPVYQGMSNGRTFIVTGDRESEGYGPITQQEALPRAMRNVTSYEPPPAAVRNNSVAFIARSPQGGNQTTVVVNGKATPAVNASHFEWSPDGSRYAYLAGNPYQSAVVDGVAHTGVTVDNGIGNLNGMGQFQWTPDSRHVAWLGGNPRGVAIDGKVVVAEGMTRFVRFTADGKHLVWLVRVGAAHHLFVDGVRVLELPMNLPLENDPDIYWSFAGDGSVSFVAQDGDAIKRFTITPGSATSVESLLAASRNP